MINTILQYKFQFVGKNDSVNSRISGISCNPKCPINVIKKILPQNCLVLITLKLSHYLRFHFGALQISFWRFNITRVQRWLYFFCYKNKRARGTLIFVLSQKQEDYFILPDDIQILLVSLQKRKKYLKALFYDMRFQEIGMRYVIHGTRRFWFSLNYFRYITFILNLLQRILIHVQNIWSREYRLQKKLLTILHKKYPHFK